MARHVHVLGILISLWGGLALLLGVSLVLLAGGAVAVLVGPQQGAVELAAGITAGTFAVLGIFTLLWGAAHLWAGRLLRQKHASGRVLTLGLGIVNLLLLPFGTMLGIYALWVLLTQEGRRLFTAPVGVQ